MNVLQEVRVDQGTVSSDMTDMTVSQDKTQNRKRKCYALKLLGDLNFLFPIYNK